MDIHLTTFCSFTSFKSGAAVLSVLLSVHKWSNASPLPQFPVITCEAEYAGCLYCSDYQHSNESPWHAAMSPPHPIKLVRRRFLINFGLIVLEASVGLCHVACVRQMCCFVLGWGLQQPHPPPSSPLPLLSHSLALSWCIPLVLYCRRTSESDL